MSGLPLLLGFMGDTQQRKNAVERKPTRWRLLREPGNEIDSREGLISFNKDNSANFSDVKKS